jgi:hypothetical protein
MMKSPTYSAEEIREMCINFELEYESFKTIVDLVDQEMSLYTDEELVIIMQASVIMFSRSMLKLSLKNLK